ncbi:hypothetical protein BDW62DRAFT_90967 [Aspergillus aurantiobrunneus]
MSYIRHASEAGWIWNRNLGGPCSINNVSATEIVGSPIAGWLAGDYFLNDVPRLLRDESTIGSHTRLHPDSGSIQDGCPEMRSVGCRSVAKEPGPMVGCLPRLSHAGLPGVLSTESELWIIQSMQTSSLEEACRSQPQWVKRLNSKDSKSLRTLRLSVRQS